MSDQRNVERSESPRRHPDLGRGEDGRRILRRQEGAFRRDRQRCPEVEEVASWAGSVHSKTNERPVATATGGAPGALLSGSGTQGAANASSTATTDHGAIAQAESTAVGSSGQAQSTATTGFTTSTATAPTGGTATTNAIAQAGGSGQTFANPGDTAYAFTVGAPDKAYSTSLISSASTVAGALLGPRDAVFGAAILGANYASDGGESDIYTATSTIDFAYGGDLVLGLIDDQESGFTNGAGFESIEFTIAANGATILDKSFTSLADAASFFQDQVIDLGASYGPLIDLTFGYTLTANGPGGYGVDFAVGGAVPEPSTWAMMAAGFAWLGFIGYRARRARRAAMAA